MAMRRESGRAAGTGKPKPPPKKKLVRQNRTTSSLGSNAAAAHGYTPSKKPIPKQARGQRQDLKPRAVPTEKEKETAYAVRMRASQPAEAKRQGDIVRTERDLNKKATKGKIKYDMRTGNYVQHRRRALLPDEHVVVDPKTAAPTKDIDKATRQAGVQHAEVIAPALKVMDQTLRPVRAVAGGVDAALKGKGAVGILKAQKKGLVENKGPLFGKVLRDQGVPKGIAEVGGFIGDTLADPTTWATGGTGKVAVRAAEKAAKDAAKKAAREGLSENATEVVKKQAAKKAAAPLEEKGSGVTVKFAGKEVPGVRRGTAAVGRTVKRAIPERVREGASVAGRGTAGQVNPRIAPVGVTKEEHVVARQADRRARATRAKGVRQAQDRARLLAAKLKKEELGDINHAIETGRIFPKKKKGKDGVVREVGGLPPHLRDAAVALRSSKRAALKERRRSGELGGAVGRRPATVVVPPSAPTSKGRLTSQVYRPGREPLTEVTADPTRTAARSAKEQRREAKIERVLREATSQKQVAQGRSEILSRNVSGVRGEMAAQRAGNPRARTLPSREEFIKNRPLPVAAEKARPLEDLARNVPERGKPGVSVEVARMKKQYPDGEFAGWGDELPGEKVVTYRDATGKVRGALGVLLYKGKADQVEVFVDPALRGRGIASQLYEAAERAGLDVEAASGKFGLTESGAALKHKRLTARAQESATRPRRAGGQVGVSQAEKAIAVAERRLRAARMRVGAAKSAHEREIATAAAQKAAREVTLARRAEKAISAKEYMPHMLSDVVEEGESKIKRGKRVTRVGSSKERTDPRPVRDINADPATRPEDRFSENLPLVEANYRMQSGVGVAKAQMHREIAERAARTVRVQTPHGERAVKSVKPGDRFDLADNEGIYRLHGGKLDEVDAGEFGRLGGRWAPGSKSGRFVVLNKQIVERSRDFVTDDRSAPGMFFDRAQGKWKRVATLSPGFHVRNAIGDTQMAYLAQPARRLPVNTAQAGRMLKRQTQRQKEFRTQLGAPSKTDQTVKVAGKRMNVDEVLDLAMDNGVTLSAQVGRELDEFRFGAEGVPNPKRLKRLASSSKVKAPARAAGRAGRSVQRGLQNREDLMRLATFKHGLDKGLKPEEAADLAMAFHIDYGDVTKFERNVARRAAPFYTFSARALPMHVKALVSTPGKIANIEKARVEMANAFGLNEDWEGDVPEWKQRAIPFGARIKGEDVALDAALPVSMLNELPTSLDMKDYAKEWMKFSAGLLGPLPKILIETNTNKSLAFRKEIDAPYVGYVSAPRWAMKLPPSIRKQLDIVPDKLDNRSGKRVAGWDPWTNYWFSQVPGLAQQFRQLTTEGALQSGRAGWQKVSGVAGVKADPIDPKTARISELFEKGRKLRDEVTKLNERPRGGGGMKSQNPRIRQLTKEIAQVDFDIYAASVGRKDVSPLRETAISNKKLLKPRKKARGLVKPKKPRDALSGGGQRSGGAWGNSGRSGGGGGVW